MAERSTVTVSTPYGPVVVSPKVARTWYYHGLPSDDVLKRMVNQQTAHRLRQEGGGVGGR